MIFISFLSFSYDGNIKINGSLLEVESVSDLIACEYPEFGIRLPFPLTSSVNLSNNKFFIADPFSVLFIQSDFNSWLSSMLFQSFDLEGLNPKEVSDELHDQLRNGVDIRLGFNADYLKLSKKFIKSNDSFAFKIVLKSCSNGALHIPGDAFNLIFSYDDGLQKGNVIDFNDFYGNALISTDLMFGFGKKIKKKLQIKQNYFDLSYGISIGYKMGHIMMNADMSEGYLIYNNDNILNLYSNLTIKSAGINVDENLNINIASEIADMINGHGFFLSGGLTLFSEKLSFSLECNDLGALFWRSNTNSINTIFKKDSITILSLIENGDTDFYNFSKDSDMPINQLLNSYLNLKISLYNKLNKSKQYTKLNKLSNARAISFGYKQPLTVSFNNTYKPDFSLFFENEFFGGNMPFGIGWKLHALNQAGSFMQLRQVVTKGIAFTLGYEAQADPIFRWGKGCAISLSTNIYLE